MKGNKDTAIPVQSHDYPDIVLNVFVRYVVIT